MPPKEHTISVEKTPNKRIVTSQLLSQKKDSKDVNEIPGNTDQQLSEIRKTIQDVNEKFTRD